MPKEKLKKPKKKKKKGDNAVEPWLPIDNAKWKKKLREAGKL